MLLCIIASLFAFGHRFSKHDFGSQGETCLALERKSAKLSYKVTVQASQKQGGRVPVVSHPLVIGIVILLEFNIPNRCGVISHDFNL